MQIIGPFLSIVLYCPELVKCSYRLFVTKWLVNQQLALIQKMPFVKLITEIQTAL